MTLYVKPFVRWIWLGAIFMALGGTLAAGDKRYRRLREGEAENFGRRSDVLAVSELQPAS